MLSDRINKLTAVLACWAIALRCSLLFWYVGRSHYDVGCCFTMLAAVLACWAIAPIKSL
ncbi:MAG TPA: hypothetical protein ACFE0H_11825 [Elainellaceae cyanobacterium]